MSEIHALTDLHSLKNIELSFSRPFLVAEDFAGRALSLPLHVNMELAQAEKVAKLILGIFE